MITKLQSIGWSKVSYQDNAFFQLKIFPLVNHLLIIYIWIKLKEVFILFFFHGVVLQWQKIYNNGSNPHNLKAIMQNPRHSQMTYTLTQSSKPFYTILMKFVRAILLWSFDHNISWCNQHFKEWHAFDNLKAFKFFYPVLSYIAWDTWNVCNFKLYPIIWILFQILFWN